MKNKKVLITGGEGSIAKGIAFILKYAKYEVLTPSRKELDITNELQVYNYMLENKPNILINCAGYIVPNTVKDSTVKDFKKHLDINLIGAFICIKEAIKYECNTVINIGSTSAFGGRKTWGSYCISKAGLLSLTEVLSEEGLESYSINPARTESKMRDRLFPEEDKNTLMSPMRLGKFVLKILKKEYRNGSHLIVKKDCYYVLPKGNCPN